MLSGQYVHVLCVNVFICCSVFVYGYTFLLLKDNLNAVMELSDENQQLHSQYEKEKQRRREVEEVRLSFQFSIHVATVLQ